MKLIFFYETAVRSLVWNKCYWNTECYFGSKVEIPSPPKRPLSAYMIFCKENRSEILKKNPDLSNPQQIKILAEKWSQLTEDMKKPYEESARESTLLYSVQHKKFYESLTEKQKEELVQLKVKKLESRRILKHKKILRESGLPKAPNSAYTLFVQSEAKKRSPALKEVASVSVPPNILPTTLSRILEKVSNYCCNLIFGFLSEKRLSTPRCLTELSIVSKERYKCNNFWNLNPSKSKPSLAIICKNCEKPEQEFIKKVAKQWNSLPEESKKVYEKQAEREKIQYAEEIREWRTRMLLDGDKKVLRAYEEIKGKGLRVEETKEDEKSSSAKVKN